MQVGLTMGSPRPQNQVKDESASNFILMNDLTYMNNIQWLRG